MTKKGQTLLFTTSSILKISSPNRGHYFRRFAFGFALAFAFGLALGATFAFAFVLVFGFTFAFTTGLAFVFTFAFAFGLACNLALAEFCFSSTAA